MKLTTFYLILLLTGCATDNKNTSNVERSSYHLYPKDFAGVYSRTTIESTIIININCDSSLSVSFTALEDSLNLTMTGYWIIKSDTLKIEVEPTLFNGEQIYWNSIDQFLIKKNQLTPIMMEFNGKRIENKSLLDSINANLKNEQFKKIEEKRC